MRAGIETASAYLKAPIGHLKITGSDDGIESVRLVREIPGRTPIPQPFSVSPVLKYLSAYFGGAAGVKQESVIGLLNFSDHPHFHIKVWKQLLKVPFGKLTTYNAIAKSVGNPDGARAVARAIASNPFIIIIPCHRVIRSDGSLGGYSADIWRKKWLLDHEASFYY